MGDTKLRIYSGPQGDSQGLEVSVEQRPRQTVTISVSEALPLLAAAVQSERTWLRDFRNDEMTISMDLYEFLLAYQYYRSPSA